MAKRISDTETILKRVGMKTFIEYYRTFQSGDTRKAVEAMKGENYTEKSVRTKAASGVRIFREGKNKEALEIIDSSDRVADDIRTKAHKLLGK